MPSETKQLLEVHAQGKLVVDRANATIRGVRVLGSDSKNRRKYTPEALAKGLAKYEGIRVNIDHPDKPSDRRRVADRFGRLSNVVIENDGYKADLKYNPEHPMAGLVLWYAENDHEAVGLSHNAVGSGKTENGIFVIEDIVSARSVDVVADPATTKGLLESIGDYDGPGLGEPGYEEHIGKLISCIIADESLDAAAKKKKVLAALNLLGDEKEESKPMENELKQAKEALEAVQAQLTTLQAEHKALLEAADKDKAELNGIKARAKAVQLCEDAKLPKHAVTDVFLTTLMESADEAAMKALVEDRRQVLQIKKPTSSLPGAGSLGDMDKKAFADFLKKQAG